MTPPTFGLRGTPEPLHNSAPKTEIERLTDLMRDDVLARLDSSKIVKMNELELLEHLEHVIQEVARARSVLLNKPEQHAVANELANDIIAMGPLEVLMRDPDVADILVNGPRQIYVERRGKLQLTDAHFRSDAHLLHIVQRIAASIGRRVDEQSPMLDARLADGSRVNVIIRPLSLRGVCMSIRRFPRIEIDFAKLVELGSTSAPVARALEIAAHCRLNIIVSGGTGSGKTTLLNVLSRPISPDERIVTIEDVAELQLQQPHVIPLETRPPNIEGQGQVVQRDLVRNALRMRPDRIIVGEVRGPEAFDMLQAMNTGHSGSMSTIHANTAMDAIVRIENMVLMANVGLPSRAILGQIASAVDLVVQIERMRDGVRRITEVAEITGVDADGVTLRELFQYRFIDEGADGKLVGAFDAMGGTPRFTKRLSYFGLDKEFLALVNPPAAP